MVWVWLGRSGRMKSGVGVVRKEWQDEEWCGCG